MVRVALIIRVFEAPDDGLFRTDESGKFALGTSRLGPGVENHLCNFEVDLRLCDTFLDYVIVAGDLLQNLQCVFGERYDYSSSCAK